MEKRAKIRELSRKEMRAVVGGGLGSSPLGFVPLGGLGGTPLGGVAAPKPQVSGLAR